jgi:ketosteroid isomerase-like protein
MSRENVEVVRRALVALDRRDVEAYLEVVSPQIELIPPTSPLHGPISGHEGIRNYFHDLWSFSETSAVHVEEIRAVEGRVLAFMVLTATSPHGIETSWRVASVYDLEHGEDPPRAYLRRPHRSPRRDGAAGVPWRTAPDDERESSRSP